MERQYELSELIQKFYNDLEKMQENGPDKNNVALKRPAILIENRKTLITNFNAVCESIKRDPILVSNYIAKELNIETSITENGQLIMNNTYQKTDVDNLFKKYCSDYVKCKNCNKLNTTIIKKNRIPYLNCNMCHATSAFKN